MHVTRDVQSLVVVFQDFNLYIESLVWLAVVGLYAVYGVMVVNIVFILNQKCCRTLDTNVMVHSILAKD